MIEFKTGRDIEHSLDSVKLASIQGKYVCCKLSEFPQIQTKNYQCDTNLLKTQTGKVSTCQSKYQMMLRCKGPHNLLKQFLKMARTSTGSTEWNRHDEQQKGSILNRELKRICYKSSNEKKSKSKMFKTSYEGCQMHGRFVIKRLTTTLQMICVI